MPIALATCKIKCLVSTLMHVKHSVLPDALLALEYMPCILFYVYIREDNTLTT